MESRQPMEKTLRVVTIFCVLFSIVITDSKVNAAASYGFYSNPNHPGKCFINETMILSPGDVIFYDTCTKVECMSETGQFYMVSCGVYGVPPNCTIHSPDRDKNYPDCCKAAFRCDHENELLHDHERNLKTNNNDDNSKESHSPQYASNTINAETTKATI